MGIKKSAGLVILYDNKILLVHPTNAPWTGTYSFPKGELQDFETALQAAIRETKEEIGLDFIEYFNNHSGISDGIIFYKNGSGKTYKKVLYFIVRLNDSLQMYKENFQLEEVDWAGFLSYEDAKEKIFWRFKPILEKVFELES